MSKAYCNEYSCGCIRHDLAGFIRRCEGQTSRSLSGRMAPKPDNAEYRHNEAFRVRNYLVAALVR